MIAISADATTRSRGKRTALIALTVGAVIAFVAAVRLVLVVAASPVSGATQEIPRGIDPLITVDSGNRARAAALSRFVSDRGVFRALVPPCVRPATGAFVATGATCQELIDEALLQNPIDGELWLFNAIQRALRGDFGEAMWNALRNSYVTARAEGWIASGRVTFGLRLYAALPADLKSHVEADLRLVLANPALAGPLIDGYIADASLRSAARPLIEALPPALLTAFTDLAQGAARVAP